MRLTSVKVSLHRRQPVGCLKSTVEFSVEPKQTQPALRQGYECRGFACKVSALGNRSQNVYSFYDIAQLVVHPFIMVQPACLAVQNQTVRQQKHTKLLGFQQVFHKRPLEVEQMARTKKRVIRSLSTRGYRSMLPHKNLKFRSLERAISSILSIKKSVVYGNNYCY